MEAHHVLGAIDEWRDELRVDTVYRTLPRNPGRHAAREVTVASVAASVVLGLAALLVSTGYFGTGRHRHPPHPQAGSRICYFLVVQTT